MIELGIIYKLTSPSGKVYIGQTRNVKRRFSFYKYANCKDQPKLYNALTKYGPKSFIYEIMDYCENQTEMNNKEMWYIREYDSVKNGYNCHIGGQISTQSKESLQKMVETKRARKAMGLYIPSKEQTERRRLCRLGKRHSVEHNRKIAEAGKNRKWSVATREKMKDKNQYVYTVFNSKSKISYENIKNLRDFCSVNNLNYLGVKWAVSNGSLYKNTWLVTRRKNKTQGQRPQVL